MTQRILYSVLNGSHSFGNKSLKESTLHPQQPTALTVPGVLVWLVAARRRCSTALVFLVRPTMLRYIGRTGYSGPQVYQFVGVIVFCHVWTLIRCWFYADLSGSFGPTNLWSFVIWPIWIEKCSVSNFDTVGGSSSACGETGLRSGASGFQTQWGQEHRRW